MSELLPNFNEEHSAKIPALALLAQLGYQFVSPSECMAMRSNRSTVILPSVLRSVLAKKSFPFAGQDCPLSESAIDKIVHELANPAMNEGLKAAKVADLRADIKGCADGNSKAENISLLSVRIRSTSFLSFSQLSLERTKTGVEHSGFVARRIP